MQVSQVTLRADMGKKVGDVAELLLPGADAAAQELQGHDTGMMHKPKSPRKQPRYGEVMTG